jgi:hypothetical protein
MVGMSGAKTNKEDLVPVSYACELYCKYKKQEG